jgi:uncharacterized protein Usg
MHNSSGLMVLILAFLQLEIDGELATVATVHDTLVAEKTPYKHPNHIIKL